MIRLRSPAFPARSLAVAICLALAACSGPAPPAADGPAASAAAAPAPVRAVQLASVSVTDLRKRAQLALREQRVFAPTGDNAIEFYVALRGRSATPDADAQGALMELQPYAVIGAEQALARGDFTEAERLRRLVAAIDPAAPSLRRIADAIEAKIGAEAQAALELAAEVEEPAKIEAVEAPSSPTATATPEPLAPSSAPIRPTPPVATAVPPAAPPAAPVPSPQPVPPLATPVASARVATANPSQELVPVRTPQPEYPASTRRNGDTGQVVASFTVLPDGSIGTIGVESVGSRQPAFERSVLAAVKRWKYQPPGEERSVRMSFAFAP